MKHTTTDPACSKYKSPRGPLSTWWFNRNRGKACAMCYPVRKWKK